MKHPRRRVLEAISEALDEIKANFEIEFVSTAPPEAQPSEVAPKVPSEAGEEEEEEFSGTSAFDREDIEVAVDVFLSHLVQEQIIRDSKLTERPSFSGVFERFFGEDHEIAKKARDFAEHIEGYFDVVSYDDVSAAYDDLLEIKRIIDSELAVDAKS
jgi:hypothetical protein